MSTIDRVQNTKEGGLSGQRFGKWTVLDAVELSPAGERRWLCRCDCGTERYVLERSLKYGGSKSCGCGAKDGAKSAASNLLGATFGDLTVVGRCKKRNSSAVRWTCLCTCGYTCDATTSQLISGKKTHCGCKTVKNYAFNDISGQKFNRLTALFRVKSKTSRNRSVVWHCRCDCGNELDISYNELVYSDIQSCGCKKKEHDEALHTLLTHVAGTSLDAIRSSKVPKSNSTGYRGVYLVKGKYLAKIVFQKKQYVLGSYDNIEDAAAARKEAEKLLFEDTVSFYEKWKAKSEQDPEWAEKNPVSIDVYRTDSGRLSVAYQPAL